MVELAGRGGKEPMSESESSADVEEPLFFIESFVDAKFYQKEHKKTKAKLPKLYWQLLIKWKDYPNDAENNEWRDISTIWRDTPATHNLVRAFIAEYNARRPAPEHIPPVADVTVCQRKRCVCTLKENL
jgi:hypothetical protein